MVCLTQSVEASKSTVGFGLHLKWVHHAGNKLVHITRRLIGSEGSEDKGVRRWREKRLQSFLKGVWTASWFNGSYVNTVLG